jgi:hypothetical protein
VKVSQVYLEMDTSAPSSGTTNFHLKRFAQILTIASTLGVDSFARPNIPSAGGMLILLAPPGATGSVTSKIN